tara:strand:+ start:2903 stop:3307 length:405 start_codon:yes stop_codon:yes gene_type:complete
MAQVLLPSNVSSNVFNSPTNVESAEGNRLLTVPAATNPLTDAEKNFTLITSLILTNKSLGAVTVNAKVTNSTSSAYILYNVNVPAGTAFEVIQGNKFILKEGDSLYVWHGSQSTNVLDVMASYTLHQPNTPYNA